MKKKSRKQPKNSKVKKIKNKTKKGQKKEKKEKKVNFGYSYRCIPVTNENMNKGKIITIDSEKMVVIKENTNY